MFSMKQIELEHDACKDVCKYEFIGQGRLILNTIHGDIIIDIRRDDVNSFVFENGKRVNYLLVKPNKPNSSSPLDFLD